MRPADRDRLQSVSNLLRIYEAMSTPQFTTGHAAFIPHAGTPKPLRSAGNLNLAPTKDNMRLRIAELERENAKLREENKSLHDRLDAVLAGQD